MSTILVTGANGQLGNEMRNMSLLDDANKYIFTDVRELDITDLDSVQNFLSENAVDFIVNCAAYTAVDKAESEIELCRKINAFAVENLAKASASVRGKNDTRVDRLCIQRHSLYALCRDRCCWLLRRSTV